MKEPKVETFCIKNHTEGFMVKTRIRSLEEAFDMKESLENLHPTKEFRIFEELADE